MGRWLILLGAFAACESADDFPARPEPLAWTAMDLVASTGTLDGTGYRIEIPGGLQPRVIGTEAHYEFGDLSIKVALYQESLPREYIVADGQFEGTLVDGEQTREDGYSFTYNGGGGAFRYLFVDDGALSCKATAAAGGDRLQRLVKICNSMVATTPLANPIQYPEGLSPRELRKNLCSIALHHVRSLEPAPPPVKKRKTKERLAAEKAQDDELEAAYVRRQQACERERWGRNSLHCLSTIDTLATAKTCVPSW